VRSPAYPRRGADLTDIKFCGITRPSDAIVAADLGAAYIGIVFAAGPRRLDLPKARAVALAVEGRGVRRVAVLDASQPDFLSEATSIARELPVEVLQLHRLPSPETIVMVRSETGLEVWAAVGVSAGGIGPGVRTFGEVADAVILDSQVPGQLGGTGRRFDWELAAAALRREVRPERLVVAGGLNPDNVGTAIALLQPDVVDVSSGVEDRPGIKDDDRMRAFVAAVRRADARDGI
jgi:phosphoribosylanthranilate isomerase